MQYSDAHTGSNSWVRIPVDPMHIPGEAQVNAPRLGTDETMRVVEESSVVVLVICAAKLRSINSYMCIFKERTMGS